MCETNDDDFSFTFGGVEMDECERCGEVCRWYDKRSGAQVHKGYCKPPTTRDRIKT